MAKEIMVIEKIARALRELDIEVVKSDEGYSIKYNDINIRLIDDEMNNTFFFIKQMVVFELGNIPSNIVHKVTKFSKECFFDETNILRNNTNIKAYWSENYSCLYTKQFSCEKDVPTEDIDLVLSEFVGIYENVKEGIYNYLMY